MADPVPLIKPINPNPFPPELVGWNWGAFLWTWIWAIGNRTWIGLIALLPIPGASFIMSLILGSYGNKWAWENKPWKDVAEFRQVQRSWIKWWFIIMVPLIIIGLIAFSYTVSTFINRLGDFEVS